MEDSIAPVAGDFCLAAPPGWWWRRGWRRIVSHPGNRPRYCGFAGWGAASGRSQSFGITPLQGIPVRVGCPDVSRAALLHPSAESFSWIPIATDWAILSSRVLKAMERPASGMTRPSICCQIDGLDVETRANPPAVAEPLHRAAKELPGPVTTGP